MICISHLLFFFQLCDMESHCVIHIQILFKSVAPHLHVKLRIWSQVACILIRGTTFIGVRVDIANKWDRVLIIVMKGVFYIVHCHKRVFFLPCNESDITLNPLCFQRRKWLYSLQIERPSHGVSFLGQNYPQDGGSFTHQKTFYICGQGKKKTTLTYNTILPRVMSPTHCALQAKWCHMAAPLWIWNDRFTQKEKC